MIDPSENYFVDGGTLRADTPSYVKRPADDELFEALLAGEYCYVLTPRQMGKSSLMIHTSRRLKEKNIRSAIVDLQATGTSKIHEWYGSVLSHIRRGLKLSVEVDAWMKQKNYLGYGQILVEFMQDVVLNEISEPVVIFIDEVDWMLRLDWRDDFFASIRALYNARAEYPELCRISFALLGVASPADLIAEPTRTPFNIGHAIPLQELSFDDVDPLLEGLNAVYPDQGNQILERIFYWTNGHPYLTQKICKAIAEDDKSSWSDEDVDRLVNKLFLTGESRKEANLKFIQDRILDSGQVGELLKFYKRTLRSRVRENGQSPIQNQLMLSGLLTTENGYVKVRNRIYLTVFDKKWIDQNMPKDWQRILNLALGVVLGILIIAFSTISFSNWMKANNSLPKYQNDFFVAKTNHSTREEVASLANIFNTKGVFADLGEDSTARKLFFSQLETKDEQLNLFKDYKEFGSAGGASIKDTPELQEDLLIIIQRINYSLVVIDPSHDNMELLQAMKDCLAEIPGETASSLQKEISFWIDARQAISKARVWAGDENPLNDTEIQGQYDAALASYGEAISIDPGNPALYFERAQLYISLRDPRGTNDAVVGKNALKDLNDVIRILGFKSSRDVPPLPPPTRVSATETPTAASWTETATPASVTESVALQEIPTPSPVKAVTRRPEAVIVTQTPVTSTPPVDSPTKSATKTPVSTLAPIQSPTLTLTPTPEKFDPGFYKNEQGEYPDILIEVQKVLQNNPWLGDLLVADPGSYYHLRIVGFITVYPTLTPTPIPTATFTPTLIVPALANLQPITEENALNVSLLGQLGKGSIRKTVYSPDGRIFAVGSSRGIYFYDSANLDPLGSIETSDGVSSLAFSPKGDIIAASLDDDKIYFWNVSNRIQVGRELIGHIGSILDLAFSPDGQLLASASADNTVRLWRIRDGELVETIDHPDIVRSLAFTSSGDLLASASADKTNENPNGGKIYLWNVPKGETVLTEQPDPVRTLDTFGSSVVAFSPDGQFLAAGSDDDSIRLWQVNDGKFLNTVSGGGDNIAFSPDGKMLAAVSIKGLTINLRRAEDNSLKLITSLEGHTDVVLSASFSSDSKTLLSSSLDNTARLWDTGSGSQRMELDDHVISPYVAVSPDGKMIASGAEDGSIYLWRLSEGRIVEYLKGHTGAVRTLAFNWNGTKLASGSDDGTVRVWNVSDGSLLFTMKGHTSNVFAVAFAPGQDWLISGSADGTIRAWDANSGVSLSDPIPGSYPTEYTIYSLAFSPKVFPVAVGLGEPRIGFNYGGEGPNSIRLLPAAGSNAINPLRGHNNAVRSLMFSPGGNMIVSGSDDDTVRLWKIDGTLVNTFSGHSDTVRSVAFSPDGRIIASASYDGTIRLWNVNDGSAIKSLTGHRAEVYSMVFSPDGKFILSGSPDGTICIWGISK